MIVGADEAGRGPVLGPLVVGAVAVSDPGALPDGVDDSKALPASTRERLAGALRASDAVESATVAVAPETIDEREASMNAVTREAQVRAIEAVAVSGATIYVDAGDVDADRCGTRIAAALDIDASVLAEHAADERHRVVGAASVLAKVERDERMAALAAEHGPVGSGYPSDPTTREFLADYVRTHGTVPPFARASWQTAEDVLAAAEQSALDEF